MSKKADDLKAKLSLPVIAAPMFLVSTPQMALECCKKGIVGSFPALNQRTSAEFEIWLKEMNDGLDKFKQDHPDKTPAPYAVNLIVHQSNTRLMDDMKLCVKYKVPIVITSLGAVPQVVQAVHGYGGIVLHDVTRLRHAKSAARAGVDGIIAVSAGAGGHAGTINPMVLVREIKKFFDGIVILAGGMTNGNDILTAETMGADFAYIGTRFLNTKESAADPNHKKMICDSTDTDVIHTSAVTGIPANFLRESLEKAGYKAVPQTAPDPAKLNAANSAKETRAWKTIWSAGQGASNIDDIPSISDLIDRMAKEYAQAKQDM